jgi:hypothetical protein
MSSLLDRYIYAVERHLPKAERQDIAAELRETIQSRIDEESASRGRDLTGDEQAAILKSVGRPVAVAGRYSSAQYLIGPSLFPYYRATLKTLAAIGGPLLVIVLVVGALNAENPLVGALRALGQFWTSAWVVFGIVTVLFWQMGRVTPKPAFDDDWHPSHLPDLPPQEPTTVPRAVSIGHVAFLSVYLLWWVNLLPLPQLLGLTSSTGRYTPALAPVWQDVSLAITLLMALHLVLHLCNIWQPVVPKWRLVAKMAGDVAALGIIYYLLQANDLVILAADGPWASRHDTINDGVRLGLLVMGALIAVGSFFDEGKRLRGVQSLGHRLPRSHFAGVVAARAVRAAHVRPSRKQNGVRGTRP